MIETRDNFGNVTFESQSTVGGFIAKAIRNTNVEQTIHYPDFAGRTVEFLNGMGLAYFPPVVSYTSGYPVITVPSYYIGAVAYPEYAASWLVLLY
jgi:hypothetical protein